MKEMRFSCEGGVLTAFVSGELDHRLAAAVRDEIDGEIYKEQPRCFVLDISGTDFMDSSGLGLIIGRYRLSKKLGAEFSLAGADSRAVTLLRLAGLDKTVKIQKKGEKIK